MQNISMFVIICNLLGAAAAAEGQDHRAPVEFGLDRSNMATQWTLAPPHEPNISPFLTSEYNKPGNFEARRVAMLDGIAKAGIGTASTELLLARMRAKVDDLCNRRAKLRAVAQGKGAR
jgi:hypothetical protein